MGREIRRVPEGWEHPRDEEGKPQPCHDETYEEAAEKWCKDFIAWEASAHPNRDKITGVRYFWEWNAGPPDEKFYRSAFTTEPTCYQVYESVSEGTPVSPVFKNEQLLLSWLVGQGHSVKASKRFIELGHAPSMIMQGGRTLMGIDALEVC